MQLKDYVQGLIDQKEIIVGAQTSLNAGLLIYQDAFPPHNKNTGKGPVNNATTNKSNNGQNKQGDNYDKS